MSDEKRRVRHSDWAAHMQGTLEGNRPAHLGAAMVDTMCVYEAMRTGDETEDAVFFRAARDIMNRTARNVGSAAMEYRRFRSFFGARYNIVKMVWDMLGEGGLRPEKCEPKHLLWALYFLKVYPREAPGCAAVGGSKGAIDPKTMRKWVWLVLERIADLADVVVSACSFSFPRDFI
jgi:hypothetical protein